MNSLIVPKKVKGGPGLPICSSAAADLPFCCKISLVQSEKVSQCRKNPSEKQQDSQSGILSSFRGSGRRFFCFGRSFDV